MSDADHGFNPIGYHTGTVWPHDNSLVMAGLVRYGYRQFANRIVNALLTASRHFDSLPRLKRSRVQRFTRDAASARFCDGASM